jgi:hypothetical protein
MNNKVNLPLGILVLSIVFSCGGTLTPEQREKARRAIEEGQIKKISPAQLTEAALNAGKKIAQEINGKDPFMNNIAFIDSMAAANKVVIYALRPGMAGVSNVEQGIAEAYQSQGEVSSQSENIQKMDGDSLLYTFPVGTERPDGSRPFSHAIAVKMGVKQLVLSIE